MNALFTALILEVIAAIILVFNGADLNGENLTFAGIIEDAQIDRSFPDENSCKTFVMGSLRDAIRVPVLDTELDSLRKENADLGELLETCQGDLTEMDNSFYSKVFKLRNMITKWGGSINLDFEESKKGEVFDILEEIFGILGRLTDSEEITNKVIKREYNQFEVRNGRYEENEVIISEFETTLLIREYLNKFHPITKTPQVQETQE